MNGPTMEFGEDDWALRIVCSIYIYAINQIYSFYIKEETDLQQIKYLPTDIVLGNSQEITLVVESSPSIATSNQSMHYTPNTNRQMKQASSIILATHQSLR